jgi:hypothetical protein
VGHFTLEARMTDNLTRSKLPHLYEQVFAKDPAGIAVLDHLWSQYMDKQTSLPLDALTLAYQAGQRSVIHFIQLNRDRVQRDLLNANEETQ